jgi:hypothetical protein
LETSADSALVVKAAKKASAVIARNRLTQCVAEAHGSARKWMGLESICIDQSKY